MARHTRATPEGAVSVIHTSRISFGKLYEACSDAEELTAWFPSRKAISGQLNRGGGDAWHPAVPLFCFSCIIVAYTIAGSAGIRSDRVIAASNPRVSGALVLLRSGLGWEPGE